MYLSYKLAGEFIGKSGECIKDFQHQINKKICLERVLKNTVLPKVLTSVNEMVNPEIDCFDGGYIVKSDDPIDQYEINRIVMNWIIKRLYSDYDYICKIQKSNNRYDILSILDYLNDRYKEYLIFKFPNLNNLLFAECFIIDHFNLCTALNITIPSIKDCSIENVKSMFMPNVLNVYSDIIVFPKYIKEIYDIKNKKLIDLVHNSTYNSYNVVNINSGFYLLNGRLTEIRDKRNLD